jgi:hypothetical protein
MSRAYRKELLCVRLWNLFTLINTKHLFFQVTESYDEVVEALSVGRVKIHRAMRPIMILECVWKRVELSSIVTDNWIQQRRRLSHFVRPFKSLWSAVDNMYHLLLTLKELCILPTQYVFMLSIIDRTNSDYLDTHHHSFGSSGCAFREIATNFQT